MFVSLIIIFALISLTFFWYRCVQSCDGPPPCGGVGQWVLFHSSMEICCDNHLSWMDSVKRKTYEGCHIIPDSSAPPVTKVPTTSPTTRPPTKKPTQNPTNPSTSSSPTKSPTKVSHLMCFILPPEHAIPGICIFLTITFLHRNLLAHQPRVRLLSRQ